MALVVRWYISLNQGHSTLALVQLSKDLLDMGQDFNKTERVLCKYVHVNPR